MIECVRCKKITFSYDKEICLACGSGATLWSRNRDISDWYTEDG